MLWVHQQKCSNHMRFNVRMIYVMFLVENRLKNMISWILESSWYAMCISHAYKLICGMYPWNEYLLWYVYCSWRINAANAKPLYARNFMHHSKKFCCICSTMHCIFIEHLCMLHWNYNKNDDTNFQISSNRFDLFIWMLLHEQFYVFLSALCMKFIANFWCRAVRHELIWKTPSFHRLFTESKSLFVIAKLKFS